MVKTLPFNPRGAGSIPAQGAKVPHASRPKVQNIKIRSNIVTNSIKTFKKLNKNFKNAYYNANYSLGLYGV